MAGGFVAPPFDAEPMTRGRKQRGARPRPAAGDGAEQSAPGKTLEAALERLETQSHFRNVTLALTGVFLKWLARRLLLKAQDAWWNAGNRGDAAGWRLRQWTRSQRARAGLRPYRSAAAPEAASVDLGTPAFDALRWNPLQWRARAGSEVGALGPVALLPAGVEADKAVHPDDLLRLRRMHHVEDAQAFHPNGAARAGTLARLAAAGVVIHIADGGERMREALGGELYDLMTADARGLDEAEREIRSVRMRRAALREHSRQTRAWRGAGEPPLVSLLLPTKRPELLPQALAAVARQTYPRLELALALHGDDPFFDAERLAAELPCRAAIVRVPASETLGAALNAAVAASSGTLLVKMDDDDAYGPEHVWDLVLARLYSQAQLVGKSGGFTYLAVSDRVIRRFAGDAEGRRTFNLAGGALLIARRDIERVGGWRNAPHSVDTLLIADVLRKGGRAHRTNDLGYMHIRHGGGHTWDAPDALFLKQADVVAPGWNPAMADLGDLPRPRIPGRDG